MRRGLQRTLRGSSRNKNCWNFSFFGDRTRDPKQVEAGGKGRRSLLCSEIRFFFPEPSGLFFFDFCCELFKRLHCTVNTCSVVFNYHTRLRNFAREKNVEKSFRSFVSLFFSSRLPPLALHGMTARNSFLAQKFVKSFLSERETTSALN